MLHTQELAMLVPSAGAMISHDSLNGQVQLFGLYARAWRNSQPSPPGRMPAASITDPGEALEEILVAKHLSVAEVAFLPL